MTQIRSMAQPVQRRPGELGVHSLDHFNFVVPDVAQAEKFYGLFGLNTKEEDGKLALYTHGHPHRWGVVSEGPRKKFTYVSFGAYEDDLPRFRERLEKMRIDRLDPPKGFESNGLWFRDPDGTLVEIRVADIENVKREIGTCTLRHIAERQVTHDENVRSGQAGELPDAPAIRADSDQGWRQSVIRRK